MGVSTKFRQLLDVQRSALSRPTGKLNDPISKDEIERIEKLIGEELPEAFVELYGLANGQSFDSQGVFFGWQFCGSAEIIQSLEFSRSLIKSEKQSIENPYKSKVLVEHTVNFFVGMIAQSEFGEEGWFKLEFSCSPGGVVGPYLYPDEHTDDRERIILRIEPADLEKSLEIVKQLHALEEQTYNWNELKFVVYSDGEYQIERAMYDFENEIPFSSTPVGAIKIKYFYFKWLPIFSDLSGNYLGIDLDPDIEGREGQIINFGRDEEEMFVLADNLENFFDKLLEESALPGSGLFGTGNHPRNVLEMTK
jgi:cell wall assembly regulator SMI1